MLVYLHYQALSHMKKLRYTVILLLIFIISACSKGEKICCDVDENLPEFYVHGIKADTVWLGKPTALLVDNELVIGATTGANSRGEMLVISIDFKGKATYPLNEQNTLLAPILSNYPMPLSQFIPDNAVQNSLTVIEHNTSTGIISGTFKLAMKNKPIGPDNATYQQFQFLNGRFRVALPK